MRKLIAAALVAASASACGQSHAEGGGPDTSRNYQVGNFKQIEVAGPYNVEVRTGSNPGVSARGSENLLDRTIVEVRGDKLVIRPQQHNSWFGGFSARGKADFTVTVPQLSGAAIAGSGNINVDRVQGASFEGGVAGSGNLSIAATDVQSLKFDIAGSGNVKAGAGKAQTAEYSIGGSGDVDAAGVTSQDLKISIAGSGGVRANATRTADVSMMGSGDVHIAGGAKCKVSKMGSGDVRCS
jgi:Putative auto-transporter adhesin, head GIN domain